MSDLIFNLRIYKWHIQISKNLKFKICANSYYEFKSDPFIKLFEFRKP